MSNFNMIKKALEYIDEHLDESINLESVAKRFHFSTFYFHRVFSIVAGRTMAEYVRERRIARACIMLCQTGKPIIDIGFECGYSSPQSFSRAFTKACGLPPREYRRQGFTPEVITVDEMIIKFANRLKGGVVLNPNIIKRDSLVIAGVSGDGSDTRAVWNAFEKLAQEKPLARKLSGNGYEIRVYHGSNCTVHVGLAVPDDRVDDAYTIFSLPAGRYASFDVFVSNGYESENNAMDEWLQTNEKGYCERLLGDAHYCVEYYDERFKGSEAGSIVEIWIPIEKKKT
ncbi:MAG: AraC family transcriptional regulator [Christensenellales bacterium]